MTRIRMGVTELETAPSRGPPASDSYVMELDFLTSWAPQLVRLNEGKRGARFDYPPALFDFLAIVRRRTRLDYRRLENFARRLLEAGQIRVAGLLESWRAVPPLGAPHFTQIRRRLDVNLWRLQNTINLGPGPIVVLLGKNGAETMGFGDWERRRLQLTLGLGWVSVPVTPEPMRSTASTGPA